MDRYTGPATVLSASAEIVVIVDLRSATGDDRHVSWAGRVNADQRSCLVRAVGEMRHYGLVLRLADGREGHFVPEGPIGSSSDGMTVRGFFRGDQAGWPHDGR